MKTATLLLLLSLTASINMAYATETSNDIDDIKAYCTEQAQLSGIEEGPEFTQYVQECIDSYTAPTGDQ